MTLQTPSHSPSTSLHPSCQTIHVLWGQTLVLSSVVLKQLIKNNAGMHVCNYIFCLGFPPDAKADLIFLMTKTSSPCWSQRHFCTVTLRQSWKGAGLIKWNILMQWGIMRSVQQGICLIRVVEYLLLDGARSIPLQVWPSLQVTQRTRVVIHYSFISLSYYFI